MECGASQYSIGVTQSNVIIGFCVGPTGLVSELEPSWVPNNIGLACLEDTSVRMAGWGSDFVNYDWDRRIRMLAPWSCDRNRGSVDSWSSECSRSPEFSCD